MGGGGAGSLERPFDVDVDDDCENLSSTTSWSTLATASANSSASDFFLGGGAFAGSSRRITCSGAGSFFVGFFWAAGPGDDGFDPGFADDPGFVDDDDDFDDFDDDDGFDDDAVAGDDFA